MPRNTDEPPAIRVYTVCDESRYLIVRNVPALGCGNELGKLFKSYGELEECKPMDGEDCEPFTDVYWIKFCHVSSARFAKKKLDEFVFLGNRLQVSYAPHYESLSDTKEKLESRRKEVLARLNPRRSKCSTVRNPVVLNECLEVFSPSETDCKQMKPMQREYAESGHDIKEPPIKTVSSNKDYFTSPSMNETVRSVREMLDKIKSSNEQFETGPTSKKARVDNRRRI